MGAARRMVVPAQSPQARRLATAQRLLAAAALLLADTARAHGSATGLAGFAEGFIHPLLEPAHLIVLIAFVLLIGQQGFAATRPAMATLCIATGIGLTAAGFGWALPTDLPLLACAAAAGIAVAVGRRWPRAVYAVIAAAIGLGIGLGSAPDGPRGGAMVVTMAGTWAGTCVWGINGTGLVEAMKRPWTRMLVRVVASWMAACAVLFLALSVAPQRGASPPAPGAPGSLDVRR